MSDVLKLIYIILYIIHYTLELILRMMLTYHTSSIEYACDEAGRFSVGILALLAYVTSFC